MLSTPRDENVTVSFPSSRSRSAPTLASVEVAAGPHGRYRCRRQTVAGASVGVWEVVSVPWTIGGVGERRCEGFRLRRSGVRPSGRPGAAPVRSAPSLFLASPAPSTLVMVATSSTTGIELKLRTLVRAVIQAKLERSSKRSSGGRSTFPEPETPRPYGHTLQALDGSGRHPTFPRG